MAQTTIEGVVKTKDCTAVANAQVTLSHLGSVDPAQKATADSQGRFAFSAVESGQYTLHTEAQGFFSSDYQLVLRPREPVSLRIVLAQKTPVEQSVRVTAKFQTIDPDR